MYMFRNSLPRVDGKVRLFHTIPDAPNVDIYANGKLVYSNLSFGKITDYLSIAPGTYDVQIFKFGTTDKALFSDSLDIAPNSILTVAVTSQNNQINYFIVNDSHTGQSNPQLSSIRFINLSPNAPLLSLSLPNNMTLFNQASYLETNNYYPISPGIYDFMVSSSDGNLNKYISDVNLTKNLFITIYIIGFFNSSPPLGYVLVKDGAIQRTDKAL